MSDSEQTRGPQSPLYHRDRYQALDRAARGFIEAYEVFGGEWFNEAPDQVYDAYERLKEALDDASLRPPSVPSVGAEGQDGERR